MNIIETLEKEQMAQLEAKRRIPTFQPGDTLRVNVKVVEGARERVQAYEGVCIARSGRGFNESFTVRKISYGEGVERVFPLYSPLIDSITVVRRGKVRRAKLYYLRGLRGKAARIPERTDNRAKALKAEFKGFKRPKGNADNLKLIKGLEANDEKRLNETQRYQVRAAREFLGRRDRAGRRLFEARRPVGARGLAGPGAEASGRDDGRRSARAGRGSEGLDFLVGLAFPTTKMRMGAVAAP